MSKESKRLRKAFGDPVKPASQSKLRSFLGGAKNSAIEASTRKLERGVHEDTKRRVEEAKKSQDRILQKRAEAEESRQAKARRDEQELQDQLAERQGCTCRNPTLNRDGKCRRCKQVPVGPARGRRR